MALTEISGGGNSNEKVSEADLIAFMALTANSEQIDRIRQAVRANDEMVLTWFSDLHSATQNPLVIDIDLDLGFGKAECDQNE